MDPAIAKNVRETISRMKRTGTTGASVECLMQCTPTRGVTIPVGRYRDEFERAARQVAKDLRFQLLA